MFRHKLAQEVMFEHGWYFRDGRPSCGGYYLDTDTSYLLPDNWRS